MALLAACWTILGQLSPWLLIGMMLSGVLHVLLPRDFVRRRFKGHAGVFQAVAIGIPLPLCSCGVIPTGIGLKNDGADDGAAVGFLISTPQTGVDSILVSMSFFGWPFALFKMVAALFMGVVGGLIVNSRWVGSEKLEDTSESHSHSGNGNGSNVWVRIVQHCYEIFRSFWVWLLIGIVASAIIQVVIPDRWLQQVGELGTMSAMLLVLVISVPLYVCATASVPMAAALVAGGFPPSAAMVFLIAGPATNTTTIGAIFGRFGLRTLIVYLIVIIGGSFVCGTVFDWLLDSNVVVGGMSSHGRFGPIAAISSALVIGLMMFCAWEQTKQVWSYSGRAAAKHEISIDGMSCSNCVRKIEEALSDFSHGKPVYISLEPPKIGFPEHLDTDQLEDLGKILAKHGYWVAS